MVRGKFCLKIRPSPEAIADKLPDPLGEWEMRFGVVEELKAPEAWRTPRRWREKRARMGDRGRKLPPSLKLRRARKLAATVSIEPGAPGWVCG